MITSISTKRKKGKKTVLRTENMLVDKPVDKVHNYL